MQLTRKLQHLKGSVPELLALMGGTRSRAARYRQYLRTIREAEEQYSEQTAS
jgi:hypothetical protein